MCQKVGPAFRSRGKGCRENAPGQIIGVNDAVVPVPRGRRGEEAALSDLEELKGCRISGTVNDGGSDHGDGHPVGHPCEQFLAEALALAVGRHRSARRVFFQGFSTETRPDRSQGGNEKEAL